MIRPKALPALFALLLSASAFADAVTDWNSIALSASSPFAGGNTWTQTRTLAHTHAAIFDAVNAIDGKYRPYVVDLKSPPGVAIDAVVASAAYTVLVVEAPSQRAMLETTLTTALNKVLDGAGKTDGIAFGKQVAEKLLAARADDGFSNKVEFKIPPPGLGVWQQTPQFGPMLFYVWGQVQPMAIKNVKEYDLGGPPALDSEQFAKDYNEVKAVGARNSSTRTADQTAVAVFWTVATMMPWNGGAQSASKAHNLSVIENARLFALLNIAAHDAQIVGIEQKARYNFWRPYNAIRYPGGPGNSALTGDPNWEPLLNTPGFQDYPSGHCIDSGAALGALLAIFPDDKVNYSHTWIPAVGVVRSWSSFTQMAKEVENARVWAGIHYRTADEHGTRMGRKVAEYAVSNIMQPK
jgi:hypothetical protein